MLEDLKKIVRKKEKERERVKMERNTHKKKKKAKENGQTGNKSRTKMYICFKNNFIGKANLSFPPSPISTICVPRMRWIS